MKKPTSKSAISIIRSAPGHDDVLFPLESDLLVCTTFYYNRLTESGWNSIKPDSCPILKPIPTKKQSPIGLQNVGGIVWHTHKTAVELRTSFFTGH